MRRLLLLVVVGCIAFNLPVRAGQFAAAEPPPGLPQQTDGTAVIVGHVVDAATGRPVAGAVVTASVPAEGGALVRASAAAPRRVLADSAGRFVFTRLAPGPVSIVANAAGYLPGSVGQRSPSGSGRAVILAEGARPDPVTIQLWKPAVIEGRLVDEAGEPLVRVAVRAVRRDWLGVRARLSATATANTDDRGVFRLARLIPGEWVVVMPATYQTMPQSVRDEYRRLTGVGGAAPQDFQRALRASGAPMASMVGERVGPFMVAAPPGLEGWRTTDDGTGVLVYPPVYYPPIGADGLEVIRLASGEERIGVQLQAVPTRAVSITGMVQGPDGPAARMGVRLTPVALSGVTPNTVFETARTVTDVNGVFTFLGVPAGEYEVAATLIPVPNFSATTTVLSGAGGSVVTSLSMASPETPTDPTLSATMNVSVGNRDWPVSV